MKSIASTVLIFIFFILLVGKSNFVFADDVSITATVDSVTPPSGGGGGGGGGSSSIKASVIFSGRAYPLSSVSLLKDGVVVATTIAGPDAKFTVSLSNVSNGSHVFTVYSMDSSGTRSSNPFTVTLFVSSGVSTTVSGIFLTPTISVDKAVVRKGDNLTVFGESSPTSDIVIEVNSENQLFFSTKSDNDGAYLFTFDTSPLELGDHGAKSKSKIGTEISEYSKIANFKVGTQTVLEDKSRCGVIADLFVDCKINIVDFSILAYWYKRPIPPTNIDLNKDGVVSIADFSIMAYYWTG
jgi:hypothetical protein